MWTFNTVNISDINGVNVRVAFSSICGTDHSIFSGNLVYYQNGIAKYPIITGHEWCGIYEGQPVVGICILGCGYCNWCLRNKPMHCNSRKEVGVVNKNGAHAEYLVVPEDSLVPIPEILPKYALTEPLAVCIHALNKIDLDESMRILISGYGCIGKLCGLVLKLNGYNYEVYDPKYTEELNSLDFDIILECSGMSLSKYLSIKGVQILLFGFDYENIEPAILSANEVDIVGTLGSTLQDFRVAVAIMKQIDLDWIEILPFMDFNKGVKYSKSGRKIIFEH